jgi:hypothetical protein
MVVDGDDLPPIALQAAADGGSCACPVFETRETSV